MAAMEAKATDFANGNADFATVNDDDTRVQATKKGTVFLNCVCDALPQLATQLTAIPKPRTTFHCACNRTCLRAA